MSLNSMLIGVMLEDCWVHSWRREEDRFLIHLDASLWPAHPSYEPPKPNEWTCYKRATLVFEGVSRMDGLKEMHLVRPNHDPDGSVDYGNIDDLREENGLFHISGEFGDVTIVAAGVHLDIE
jgi:hypothetical protein